ncbi:hypothetical protein AB0K00_11470 [Dactylosporangium sp. NPDC049525]|uniref:hypothetical protein n=1 Tax=Dactylosporangium sp. NPDC049525 TaxID=3154730 RepID=UPI00341FB71F
MTTGPAPVTSPDEDDHRVLWAGADARPALGLLRRRVALALTVLATAALATVATGLWTASRTSWRFVAFVPLELPVRWMTVVAAALAVIGGAALLGLRHRPLARVVMVINTVVALFTICLGAAENVVRDGIGEPGAHPGRTAATLVTRSPGGGLSLVVHDTYNRYPGAAQRHYRLRTTGWPGREGRTDVACTDGGADPNRVNGRSPAQDSSPARDIPAVRVASARFTDANRLELAMTDGRTWTVRIDDVNPDRTLDWCGKASDQPR